VAELTGTNDRLEKDLESARKGTEAALAAQSQAVSAAQPDAYKMEIGTLQARVKELEGQIEDDRSNSAKEVANLATQLQRTRETNKSLTEANRALMNAKQAETPTVDKAEFDQLQARARELATEGDETRRLNEKLADDNQRLVAEHETLTQQLAEARKVTTASSGLGSEKAALQERLEAVGAQLIKTQQEVDTLQKENADATSQALASKQAADKAQADLAASQGIATEAEKASESHNTAVAELTGANTKLETERDDLRKQLAALKADNTRLTQTTGSLEQLKADADRSAQQNITALSAQLNQLQHDLQGAREANSRLVEGNVAQERDRTAVINQLRNENAAFAARLSQAQGTLDQIASAARLGTPAATIASGGTVPARPAGTPKARVHTVVEGDSLSRISMRYYGTPNRWQEIYNANRDVLQGSSTLRVGMQLRIP
jgi:nucleoid-associated protein YgaU